MGDNPNDCQTAVQTTYWDQERQRTRKLLEERGLVRGGEAPKPWVAAAEESLAHLRGTNPQAADQATLDLAVAKAVDDAIDRLVAATERLVDASNSSTTTMARLQRLMVGLTVVYVIATAFGVYFASTARPPVVNVSPPAVTVQLPSAPTPRAPTTTLHGSGAPQPATGSSSVPRSR